MGTTPPGADLLGYTTGAMPALAVGKLPPQLLERLLGKVASTDPRVVMGPRLGEDAAVLDMGDRYLVATAHPITFATHQAGWEALPPHPHDLAVRRARPPWFPAPLPLPQGAAP